MYLPLPSNASLDFFPDNTLTEYTTKLPKRVELNGNWEAAIDEIIFPKSWYNIGEEDLWIRYLHGSDNQLFQLDAGYYPTIESVHRALQRKLGRIRRPPIAIYHEKYGDRFSITVKKRTTVNLSRRFRDLLGFASDELTRGTHTSTRAFDLDENRQVMLIYCDILESRLVGDGYAPLLGMVATEGRYGSFIHKQYDRLQYHKVQKMSFDTVK